MKITKIFRATSLALTFASVVIFNGCISQAPIEPGSSVYNKVIGELTAKEEYALDNVWTAAQSALEELELDVITRDKDALTGVLKARGAEGKDIKVRLERLSKTATLIKVKVDFLGDELQSNLVLEKIQDNLNSSVPMLY